MWLGAKGMALVLVATMLDATPSPTRAGDVPAPDAPLTGYTFRVTIEMSMRHFPWLHFHADGIGRYERDREYDITFTHSPPFCHMQTLDLSPLDRAMWSKSYRAMPIEKDDAQTVYQLTPLQNDGKLLRAFATADAIGNVLAVAFDYNDGTHIRLTITSHDVAGHILPTIGIAEIDLPHMPIAAQAQFFDYEIPKTR